MNMKKPPYILEGQALYIYKVSNNSKWQVFLARVGAAAPRDRLKVSSSISQPLSIAHMDYFMSHFSWAPDYRGDRRGAENVV
jgi:hypothetical protein